MLSIVPIVGFPVVKTGDRLFMEVSKGLAALGHVPDLLTGDSQFSKNNLPHEIELIPFVITCIDTHPGGLVQALSKEPLIQLSSEIKYRLQRSDLVDVSSKGIPEVLEMQKQHLSLWKHDSPTETFKAAVKSIYYNIQNKELSTIMISDELGLPLAALEMDFVRCSGCTVWQFVINTRMGIAKKLLETTSLNVFETAFSVGFTDASNFARSFRKTFGIPPMTFRNTNNGMRIQSRKPQQNDVIHLKT